MILILTFVSLSNAARNLDSLPTPAFSTTQIQDGGFILYIIGIIYLFLTIREVCAEYLLPSLTQLLSQFHLKVENAGSALYTLGICAPEIYVMLFATFLSDSSLGFGTILGSSAIRGLLFIGIASISSSKGLEMQWWVLVRDSMFSLVCLGLMIMVTFNLSVSWWEGLILILFSVLYTFCLVFNKPFERFIKKKLKIPYDGDETEYHPLPEKTFAIRRYSVTDLKEFIPPQLNFSKGVLAKMLRNAQLQEVKSHSEKIMQLRAKLKKIIYIILQAIEEKKRCSKQNRLDRRVTKKFEGEDLVAVGTLHHEVKQRIRKLESIRAEEVTSNQVVQILPGGSRLKHYILLPVTIIIKSTIPNYKKYSKLSIFAVLSALVWVGFLCYLLVWWMTDFGRGLTIPIPLLGMIFISIGITLPELISVLIKVVQIKEDSSYSISTSSMNILSNSIRTSIINMSLGLGLSWFFYSAATGSSITVPLELFNTELALIGALGMGYIFIGGFKWKMSKSLGVVLIFFYMLFILFYLLFQFKQLS